jgi:hypothetical protein
MKSLPAKYADILQNVLSDSSPYESGKPLARDISYMRSRTESEGLSFLTKTLPSFGKSIMSGIETGSFIPPQGFALIKGSLLPKFLQGWTRALFSDQGELLARVDPYALQEVIQICMLFYKLEVEYSEETTRSVLDTFIQTEDELPAKIEEIAGDSSILNLARRLIGDVLRGYDPRDIRPGHGPGKVATGEWGNGKFTFRRKYQRLHQEFPYYRYFSPSLSAVAFESGWYARLLPQLNAVAKVTLVPKDSRGPRLISMEPLEVQWIQQGIMRSLVPHIESSATVRGEINFEKQDYNQFAALWASLNRRNATVDLKEASDRVSLVLFRHLFPEDICKSFEACRSVATRLPCGRVLPLKKFAPMGSALCFPVLALTVWAIAKAALILYHRNDTKILVYGDDLVVPSSGLSIVADALKSVGLQLNVSKTYVRSHFRESCGTDAFMGKVITPIRMKKPFSLGRRSSSLYLSLISLSESFFDRGYWKTTAHLRAIVEDIFGKVPWTNTKGYPGFYTPSSSQVSVRNKAFKKRWNSDHQLEEVRVLVAEPREIKDPIKDSDFHVRLLKGLLGLYRISSEDHSVEVSGSSSLRWRFQRHG